MFAGVGDGGKVVRDLRMAMYALPYLKWITNKDLL